MSKLLYSQATATTHPYPRNDDAPIIGLDPDFLVLEKLPVSPPTYDPETEIITSNWVVDIDALEYRQEWVISDKPLPEPIPNWDGFNAAILSNPEFNERTGVVLSVAPAVALAIPAALAQVESNGVSAFSIVYGAFIQVGAVSEEVRESWAMLGEEYNLPADFIDVVRGVSPGS